jgi:hypothetical protein
VALHQNIQRLLLLGIHLEPPARLPAPLPPQRLVPLIAAVAPAHREFDERAVHFGHRYRSGFWSIYMLSAIAVLCAILPLALGWDSSLHALHPYAGLWAVAEVCVIGTVSAIYYFGHKHDWQGEWLRARTTAELTWYLPLIAPLVDFTQSGKEANWYLRVFDPGQHPIAADQVAKICVLNESLASKALEGAWDDAAFVAGYAQWTVEILEDQRRYHHRIASKQKALLHRVHSINIWLFGLTALGALMHLLVHTLWLSLITTFFPALGASLHGALAQSEAYRLRVTSEHLVAELQGAVETIRAAFDCRSRATARHCDQSVARGSARIDTRGTPGLADARASSPFAARMTAASRRTRIGTR